MSTSYLLVIVIQDYYKSKEVLKRLEEIGVTGATGIDTMGAATIAGIPTYDMYDVVTSVKDKDMAIAANFNKTIFSVVKDEEIIKKAMDEVEKIIEKDEKATGQGIMFTIPLAGQMGLL